jgi:hypothetical protein
MDLKRKTQLRNLLTAYRNEVCDEARENAEETYNMTKCEVCDMTMSDGTCIIDKILLRIENELWEGYM